MHLKNPLLRSLRTLLLPAVVAAAAAFPSTVGAAPDDPFVGAWTGTGGPGSTLRLNIGEANTSGARQVTFSVQGGEQAGPDVSCVAHGRGTVSLNGSGTAYLLNGTWRVYNCEGGEIDASGFGFLRPVSLELVISGSDTLHRRGS